MAIYGSLQTMPLADILQWIKTTSRAGVLTVARDGEEWELLVDGNYVTRYKGPELRENLGLIVVTSGLLTEEDLRQAMEHQRREGLSLHWALLELELLTAEQLQECLVELARESLYDMFIDLPGEFVFSDRSAGGIALDLDDEGEGLELKLNINYLLMEGAQRQDDFKRVGERFPDGNVRVRIRVDRLPPSERLGVRERRILASLAAGQNVSDICFELRAPILSVLRSLMAFEQSGAVEFLEPTPGEATSTAGDRLADLLKQAEILRNAGQYDETISLLEVGVRMRPDAEGARTLMRETLEEQIKELYAALPPLKVPVLVADEGRLRKLQLRPEERFLLNRLNAHMDIGSLIMISSLNERETLKVLKRLVHSNIIRLR